LKKLLDDLLTMSFLDRLFGWKRIKDQLMTAAADLARLNAVSLSQQEKIADQSHELDLLEQKNDHLPADRNRHADAHAQLRSEDEKRRHELNKQMSTLEQYQQRIIAEREAEKTRKHQAELDRLEQQKFTWL